MFSIRARAVVVVAIATLAASGFLASQALGQQKPAPAAAAPPPANPDGLRNVTVLKNIRDVLPEMHFMRASLGVTCDFCHVAERDQYWRDDKPEKVRARQMMLMTQEINRANFGGRQVVTCNTCHRGSPRPVGVPPIGQGTFPDTTHAEPVAARPGVPAAQVVADYLKALGGREKLEALTSRAARMTVLRSAVVDAGTPKARAVTRGQAVIVETLQQGPDRRSYRRIADNGQTLSLLIVGDKGWVAAAPAPPRPMAAADLAQAEREWRAAFGLGRELDIARRFAASTAPARRDTIDGREVQVLAGPAAEPGATERLYFDAQTGLLTRRLLLRPTQVGPDPEQTDYADYRPVDGVLIPFRITTSYLDDSHLGLTRLLGQVRHNAPIDPHAFDPPPAATAAAGARP
jgi:hypothetical protein